MDSANEPTTSPNLHPEIEPYRFGCLNTGGIHEIYYEEAGNPRGTPLFILHGGPGRWMQPRVPPLGQNPDCFRMVLHDQRGAGRSRPFGELRENTTQYLVQDIEDLRRHLGIERCGCESSWDLAVTKRGR